MILRALVVGPFAENTYVVGSEETGEALVIDPGAEPDKVLQALQDLGLTLALIANTHGHGDHTGAIAALKEATGAPFAIHQGDLFLLDDPGPMVRMMMPTFQPPPQPDRLLQEGDTLDVGDLSFQVLETPGHTPGGLCFYGHGVVFTGDTLFQMSIGRFDLPGSNGRQLLRNIHAKLLALPPDTQVYPGHGEGTTIGREKAANPFLRQAGPLFI